MTPDAPAEGHVQRRYLEAILRTMRQPLVILDDRLAVENANRAFLEAFRLDPDAALPARLGDLAGGGLAQGDLPDRLRRLLSEGGELSGVRIDGVFDGLGRRVMLLDAQPIELSGEARLLVALQDITDSERIRHELEGQKEYAEKIVDATRDSLLILGWDLRVVAANATFYRTFRVDAGRTEGRLVYELGNGQWNIPALRDLLEEVLPRDDTFDDFVVEHTFVDIGPRTMVLNARRIDHLQLILLAIEDRTEARRAAAIARDHAVRQELLLELSDEIGPLAEPGRIQLAACRVLGRHLGAARVAYAEDEGDGVHVVLTHNFTNGVPGIEGRYRYDDYAPGLLAELRAGRTVLRPDIAADPQLSAAQKQAHAALGLAATLNMPLVKDGRLVAILSVHYGEPHRFCDREVDLVAEVAERTWAAVVRARAEVALREAEERYGLIVDGARDYAIFTTDEEGLITSWPTGAAAVFGWPAEEMVGTPFARTFTPQDRADGQPETELATAARDGVAPDVRWHLRRDGSRVFIEGAVLPLRRKDGTPRGFIKVGQDVTERRRAAERLADGEARLSAIFEGASVGLSEVDAEGRVVRANAELCRILGRSREEMRSASIADVTHPDDLPQSLDLVRRVVGGTATADDNGVDKRYLRPDGTVVWAHSRATLLPGPEGAPGNLLVVTVDLTARKAAEQAVRESEARFRQFGDASSDALWIRDAETLEWEYLSPAFDRIYGIDREAALARRSIDFLAAMILPEDREATLAAIAGLRQGDRGYEYRIRRRSDGAVRWLRTTGFRLVDADGRVRRLGGITHDMTEEKLTADRMEVLLAELQHRTRNLIGVVRAMASRTLRTSTSIEEFRDRFGNRLEALARVNGLLSRLDTGQRVSFDQLLETELRGHGLTEEDGQAQQVALSGPAGITLPSASVQTLALALHELLTNATKHGALAGPDGRLDIRWEVVRRDGPPRLRVDWRESGTVVRDPAAAPRGGYGRELIERALPYQLGAETRYDLEPGGLHCVVTLPVSRRHGGGGDA